LFADQSAAEQMEAGVHLVPIPKLLPFLQRKVSPPSGAATLKVVPGAFEPRAES
jgi:hypothetical protein